MEPRRPIPEPEVIARALRTFIGPAFAVPALATERQIQEAADLLRLECVGGPELPAPSERDERVGRVRELLKSLVLALPDLSQSELEAAYGFRPRTSGEDDAPYEQEAFRLAEAAETIFQTKLKAPKLEKAKRDLYAEADALWDGGNRWFERQRLKALLRILADRIIERERQYREATPYEPGDHLEETSTGGDISDPERDSSATQVRLTTDDVVSDESAADFVTARRFRSKRWSSLAVGVAAVVAVALAIARLASMADTEADRGAGATGPVSRLLRLPNMEVADDLAATDGSVWAVSSTDQTAAWIPSKGKPVELFVDQPGFSAPLARGTGLVLKEYRVAARGRRAWVTSANGTVSELDAAHGRVRRIIRLGYQAESVLVENGTLWVGGGAGALTWIDTRTARIEGRVYLREGHTGPVDLTAGFGAIWALDTSGRYLHKVEPARNGVVESILPLERAAWDVEAGYGGIWTADRTGSVTRYDPATGARDAYVRIPGKARTLALAKQNVWVASTARRIVRIDAATQRLVGRPILLPDDPQTVKAGQAVWVGLGDNRIVKITPPVSS